MALRPYPKKINTEAKVEISIPEADMEYHVDWGDAGKTKAKAARWLGDLPLDSLPEGFTVVVKVWQRSPDVTFTDRSEWVGEMDPKEFRIEYGARFLTDLANWGRSR